VAIVALVSGSGVAVKERSDRFRSPAAAHFRASMVIYSGSREGFDRLMVKAGWHGEIAREYDRAARYPWLHVAPDPAGPE
jgi:hypothetical protein